MKNKFEIPELEVILLEDDMYANGGGQTGGGDYPGFEIPED